VGDSGVIKVAAARRHDCLQPETAGIKPEPKYRQSGSAGDARNIVYNIMSAQAGAPTQTATAFAITDRYGSPEQMGNQPGKKQESGSPVAQKVRLEFYRNSKVTLSLIG
jgi:hypothetical protein